MVDDDGIIGALLGGILGAALASPKPEDKQALEEYKTLKAQIASRTQKIPIPPDFLARLGKRPEFYNAFIESYRAYSYGLFRSSVIIASALIESMLRNKFEGVLGNILAEALSDKKIKRKTFYELIEEANKTKVIEEKDYYFLQGLRIGRNDSAHDILKEVSEIDAVMTLNIAIKIIWGLI